MKLCLKGKLSNFKDKYAAFQLIYSLSVSPSIRSTPPWPVHNEGKIFGHHEAFLLNLDIYAQQLSRAPHFNKIYIIYIYIVLILATKGAKTTYICSVAV